MFAVDCKIGVAFKQTKRLVKSGIHHQREVFIVSLED